MFQDKYVFAQLVSFLNRSKFNRIVAKYNGDRYVKHFTCWNQLLALMFGQLSNRESLRDLVIALVRIQIYAAICTYCLVAIIQHDMKLDRSTYEVLQILSISLTDKTNLRELFSKTKFQYDKERLSLNGPNLFNF